MQRNGLVRSGEFAQRAGVTKKTLQVYLDKGILLPDHVDEDNGYRYYAVERISQLEEILKMREVGLSLDDIKDIAERKDSLHYLDILYSRLGEIDRSIAELETSRAAIQTRIDNQEMFLNPPALRHCFVEYQPKRPCVRYPIEPYRGTQDSGEAWLNTIDAVRRDFRAKGIPLKFMSNIGAEFDASEMRAGRLVYSNAIIFPDDVRGFENVGHLPAGYYATMYDQRYMSDGNAISRAVDALMSFVNTSGYETRGEYVQVIAAETTMFEFNSRMLYVVKEQVPIVRERMPAKQ